MNTKELVKTAKELFADNKGLLAMDESTASCNKRFAKLGIPETEEARKAWRELIITTPGLSESVSGVILYDETIRQIKNYGDIIPGIKVDEGLEDMPGHPGDKITKGLEGLPERLKEYYSMGARFAKWRAAFEIGHPPAGGPSQDCVEEQAKRLAEYAYLCQEAGIVPMVEPEVLMDGAHTLQQCHDVTENVLKTVFKHLAERGVALEGMILKPNMAVPGLACPTQESVEEVADVTVYLLTNVVPKDVAGIAFLSGGQSGELAAARLNAMHVRHGDKLPWPVTFSYSRAIQYPALEIWAGKEENVAEAQKSLAHRANICRAATRGQYTPEMEKE